jgi:hypothetical protein
VVEGALDVHPEPLLEVEDRPPVPQGGLLARGTTDGVDDEVDAEQGEADAELSEECRPLVARLPSARPGAETRTHSFDVIKQL